MTRRWLLSGARAAQPPRLLCRASLARAEQQLLLPPPPPPPPAAAALVPAGLAEPTAAMEGQPFWVRALPLQEPRKLLGLAFVVAVAVIW